ncbi:carbohydrate-binding module family 18 protein [Diplogelasinospora grovesii]|uniref:Carbohydrate-binding module family 18 protein n=1 Tax=Diplogelasinospora grovesii TaxID=303347 RepID=A0AAN6RXH0_9PEZI|nr:carbohydrate-binding module family 18 protein [Diplogelasinospora grovesii]
MKPAQGTAWSRHLVFCAISLYLTTAVQASDDCAPSIWQPGQFEKRALNAATSAPASASSSSGSTGVSSSLSATPTANATVPVTISPLITTRNATAGQVNCRYTGSTEGMDINYYTYTALALHPDFIKPLRATAGLCGPLNKNATCLGTALQCCNLKTWTCGNFTQDCANGTCYEGACAGDSVFTTTGECGSQHGYKQCARVWGDCCNADGKCGTGPSFCGYGVCQLGNCTVPPAPSGPPSWLNGNTTDGTCGGPNSYTCNVVYGNCCNKNGMCGSLPSDCGAGCLTSSIASSSLSSSTKVTTSGPITTSGLRTSSPGSKTSSTSTTKSSTHATTTATSAKSFSTSIPGEAALPSCAAPDAYCLCNNVDFSNGIRDCSNGACGTAVASTVIAFGSAYCATAFATHTATTTGLAALPSCGQTCFNNMLAQYSSLGCASPSDSYCLCNNVNFSNGLRDCSNGACGTAVGSSAIAYGSAYCSTASATHTTTGLAALPSYGQTCFNNMVAQYSALGCASPAPSCLCQNVNFGYGLRDCSNGACGTAVASTVIAYGSSYCASVTAAH